MHHTITAHHYTEMRFSLKGCACGSLLLAMLAVAAVPCASSAQDTLRVLSDTTRVQVLRLSDGSVVVGRVIELRGDSAVVRTASGQLTVARTAVSSVRERPTSSMRGGVYWPEDPNATRLYFAPTGHMLEQGEGYFCDIMLFLLCLTGGLSDRFTLGGGMSIVPGIDISENVFYLTPKLGVVTQEKFGLAVGAFVGWSGAVTDEASSFGILYGVSTFGDKENNLSLGLGWPYYSDEIANSPIVLAGLKLRMTRGMSFVSENYILPNEEGGIISYGVRLFNDRIAGDVALFRLIGEDSGDQGIGIPFLGLAVKFR